MWNLKQIFFNSRIVGSLRIKHMFLVKIFTLGMRLGAFLDVGLNFWVPFWMNCVAPYTRGNTLSFSDMHKGTKSAFHLFRCDKFP